MAANYTIRSIEGNRQRLDGGAMFGNAPRTLWERWAPADEHHRIGLACRGFLIHDRAQDRRILLETGVGAFFEPKLRDRYGVFEKQHVLLENLRQAGVQPEQIDVIVLSHLHFDHAGGLLSQWQNGKAAEAVFPSAKLVVGKRAWERAQKPHSRDRASFIPQIVKLIDEARVQGRLELISDGSGSATQHSTQSSTLGSTQSSTLGPDFSFHFSDGHTPGLLLTELKTTQGSVLFSGDLIPGRPWIHLPISMGYDRYAELVIDEKQRLLTHCLEQNVRLLMTHDSECASCRVCRDTRGRYRPSDELAEVSGLEL